MSRSTPNPNIVYPIRNDVKNIFLDRIDPLHEITWKDAVATEFKTVGGFEQRLAISGSGQLVHKEERFESPVALPKSLLFSDVSIKIVACLTQFFQMTTMQLSAITSETPNRVEKYANALYTAGVLERARPVWLDFEDLSFLELNGSGNAWRVNIKSDEHKMWLRDLTDLEYLLIAGSGREITKNTNSSRSTTSIRHNLSAAEIMLRSLEMCPSVVGVWGERVTSADSLIDKTSMMDLSIRQNISDGAIVLKDGSVVLIETSGSLSVEGTAGKIIQRKAAAWTAICALSEIDLKVIFIDLSPTPKPGRFRWYVKSGADMVTEYLVNKGQIDEGKRSIFAANAHDWFPNARAVSRGFIELESWNVLSEKYEIVAPEDLPLVKSELITNTLASIHIPDWALEKKPYNVR